MFGESSAPRNSETAAAFGRQDGFGLDQTRLGDDDGGQAFDVAEYWRLVLKHRLVILGTLVAALIIGAAATLLMTPIYTATLTLQIDRESARILNVEEIQPRESGYQSEEFFQTQYGLLRSRSLAERVTDTLGLASSDQFLEQMGVKPPASNVGTATERSALRRRMVLRQLQAHLNVAPVRGSRLVTVSFDSPDPQLSARIVNAIAENFIQVNLDRKFESSKYARQFLEERIAQTKARLEDTERQLVAYASNQQIINITEAGADGAEPQSLATSNLVALNGALGTARAARVAAEEKWRQARTAAPLSLPEVLQNPAVQQLVQQRAAVEAEYEQKSRIYQPDWPEMQQLRARQNELDRQINTVASAIRNSIRGQYVIAANEEQSLQRQVNGLTGDVLDQRSRSVQYNILARELDTSRTLYDGLLQRYKEVGVTAGVASNNISIVDRAMPPTAPSKPQLLVNMAIAAFLGLGLGLAAAFLMEALNESLSTPDDVESKLGLSVLGVSPLLEVGQSPIQALGDIRSSFSEAYYSLRTALQFSTPNGAPATMLVTSSRPAEGKSTTAYAVALTLARVGKRVLLIDGDLRNPSMHRVVGVDNVKGMSNLLSGGETIAGVAMPTREPNLMFIPCGPLPPNPAELWGSDRLFRVLEAAKTEFDHVVIDGPPVLGFADAPLLASSVAGTLFAIEAGTTRRAQARGALRRLMVGNARILGAVLTKFNAKATQYGGYEYAYDYTYGAETSAKKGRPR